jgi:heme-degrading monooxygenase HmoA
MSVLKRHHVPGMTREQYDQASASAGKTQLDEAGFQAHYAVFDDGGVTVVEVWDSQEAHDAWYDAVLRPMLPAEGVPAPEFTEIHHSRTR